MNTKSTMPSAIPENIPMTLVSLLVATFGTYRNGEGLSLFYLLVLIIEGFQIGYLAKAELSESRTWLFIIFRTLRSIGISFILCFIVVMFVPSIRSDLADPRGTYMFGLMFGAPMGIIGVVANELLKREAAKA